MISDPATPSLLTFGGQGGFRDRTNRARLPRDRRSKSLTRPAMIFITVAGALGVTAIIGVATLCSSARAPASGRVGTVTGTLVIATALGGSSGPGTVTLTNIDTGKAYNVAVGQNGSFTIRLATGSYYADGGSPDFKVGAIPQNKALLRPQHGSRH